MTDEPESQDAKDQAAIEEAQANDKAEAKQVEETGKPVRAPAAYTTTHDVYVSGKYTKAGDVFVTDAEKEDDWTARDPDETAAIQAATNAIPTDPPLENLSVEALQAIATNANVNTAGIETDKNALITAIKAADEPRL